MWYTVPAKNSILSNTSASCKEPAGVFLLLTTYQIRVTVVYCCRLNETHQKTLLNNCYSLWHFYALFYCLSYIYTTLVMTTKEVMEKYGVSRCTITRWAKKYRVPIVNHGLQWSDMIISRIDKDRKPQTSYREVLHKANVVLARNRQDIVREYDMCGTCGRKVNGLEIDDVRYLQAHGKCKWCSSIRASRKRMVNVNKYIWQAAKDEKVAGYFNRQQSKPNSYHSQI